MKSYSRIWIVAAGTFLVVAAISMNLYLNTTGTPSLPKPTEIPISSNQLAPKIVFYGQTALFLTPEGSLWGWGNNANGGFLHRDVSLNFLSPIRLGDSRHWIDIAVNNREATVLMKNGTLWKWGLLKNRFTPDKALAVSSDSDWASIDGGFDHTLALRSNGSLWAWGENRQGQLGDGTMIKRKSPVPIAPQSIWANVACGFGRSAGVQTDGTLWAWGQILPGQDQEPAPIQLGSDTDWLKVHSVGLFSIAQKTDGTLWMWGIDDRYSIQDKSAAPGEPYQVDAGTDWQSVAGGPSGIRFLGIKQDGSLWTVVDAQQSDAPPRRIGEASNWTHVWSGDMCYVAMNSDGELWTAGCVLGQDLGYHFTDSIKLKTVKTLNEYGANLSRPANLRRKPPPVETEPWMIMRLNKR